MKKILLIISTILLINLVSAYQCFFLTEGQLDCHNKNCMNCYDDNLNKIDMKKCQGVECVPYEEGSQQSEELELNIISPKEKQISASRSILLDLESSNPVSLWYGRSEAGRWTTLARNITKINKKLTFGEGEQKLFIKATDNTGKSVTKELSLFVDSKKPQIRTYTRTKYINGKFEIKILEDNLKSLSIFINNNLDEISLDNCIKDRSYFVCSFALDLSDYENKEIEYYFLAEDIANNKVEGRKVKAIVDTQAPKIENVNISMNRNRVNVVLKINESNFNKAYYNENRIFCSDLTDDECEKLIKYQDELNVTIFDLALNVLITKINLKGGLQ